MTKLTARELTAKIREAREWLATQGTNYFRHYKGGVYKVTGFGICCETQVVEFRYYRVGGPGCNPIVEAGNEFHRKWDSWHAPLSLPGPNGGALLRFTPVFVQSIFMDTDQIEACEYRASAPVNERA